MKETIRAMALAMGADVCGFSDIRRFADAPEGFSPKDLFPACQTVIVIGIALPKGLMKVDPRLVYHYFNESVMNGMIDGILLRLARETERLSGCAAVPVPCDDPYEYWDAGAMEGRGLISMKHAAVCAGLGTLGKNTLLLNREYGNRLNLGLVLTDLVLPPDPLAESVCIQGCTKCADSCPSGAIQSGHVEQKLCRQYAYAQKTARGYSTTVCNACRNVCPVAFGLKK